MVRQRRTLRTDPIGMCPDDDQDGKCDPGWRCYQLPPAAREKCLEWADCGGSKTGFKVAGYYNLSAYYVVNEARFESGYGSDVTGVPGLNNEIPINKYFLYSNQGVCMQGTGKLKGGGYISCIDPVNWSNTEFTANGTSYVMPGEEIRNNIQFHSINKPDAKQYERLETVAVCAYDKDIPRSIEKKVEIRIYHPILEAILRNDHKDNIFYPTDVGGGLCKTNGIDIFLGEQPSSSSEWINFYSNTVLPIINIDKALVEVRDNR